MAELADAQDLGSCAFGHGGSTPPPRTTQSFDYQSFRSRGLTIMRIFCDSAFFGAKRSPDRFGNLRSRAASGRAYMFIVIRGFGMSG